MCNALHLSEKPGSATIKGLGGLGSFMGWEGPIMTDSGGFQVWSLARDRGGLGTVTDKGFVLGDGKGRTRKFGPQRAMTAQLRLGADIVFTLDQCTHPDDPPDVQDDSVRRTLAWARTCRDLVDRHRGKRPLLYAVIQGGREMDRRRRCVDGLLEIGFDGYGFGGVPFDEHGALEEAVGQVAELLPPDVHRHALGIGRPNSVLAAWRAGWRTFDAVSPTREARRGLVYVPTVDPTDPVAVGAAERVSAYLDLTDDQLWRDPRPIEEGCECPACRRYSRAYLSHLLRTEDAAGATLATLHNLAFLQRMVRTLRAYEAAA